MSHNSDKQTTWGDSLHKFGLHLATGGGALAISKSITAPLERVRIILQVQTLSSVSRSEYFKSAFDAFKRIYYEQGFAAFFRGNGTNLLRIIPNSAIRFVMNEKFQNVFKNSDEEPTFFSRFLSGASSAALSQIIAYPLDLVRTRLSADLAKKREPLLYRGITDCIIQTTKKEGITALYKGFSLSLLSVIPYYAIAFSTYGQLDAFYTSNNQTGMKVLFTKVCMATFTTIFAQTVCYPLDTIKRRLQMNGLLGHQPLYKNVFDCCMKMMKTEGIASFYRGCLLNVIRNVPYGAIQFYAYDFIKSAIT